MSEWTPTRIDLLRRLWDSSLSASQIAVELGGITRNSVIGKVHRLGLPGRLKGERLSDDERRARHRARQRALYAQQAGSGRVRRPRHPWRQIAAEQLAPTSDLPGQAVEASMSKHRCSLIELAADRCRWPIGDPQRQDFHFCGGKPVPGLPYCLNHCRLAYQPSQPRMTKSRRAA